MIYGTSNSGSALEELRPVTPTAIAHFDLETLTMEDYGPCVCTELLVSYSFLYVQNPGPTDRLITYSYIHICFSCLTPLLYITADMQRSFEIS
jgi:hypothetical protein